MNRDQILQRIRDLCAERHWTLHKLVLKTELSSGMIYQWFNTERMPSLNAIAEICVAFEITMGEFFTVEKDTVREKLEGKLAELVKEMNTDDLNTLIEVAENLQKNKSTDEEKRENE